jgi:hypothetical protein
MGFDDACKVAMGIGGRMERGLSVFDGFIKAGI